MTNVPACPARNISHAMLRQQCDRNFNNNKTNPDFQGLSNMGHKKFISTKKLIILVAPPDQ
jgi:hypothetical protein